MDNQSPDVFNQEETSKLNGTAVYKQYKQWLHKNGVIVDGSVVYPAYFGPKKKGVVGVAASKPIAANHAVIAVPYNLIITVPKIKEDADLLKIIQENPNLFKISDDSAFSILTLFVVREMVLEKKSFYHPYFAIAEDISLVGWSHWDMLATESPDVTRLMKAQLEELEGQFMSFLTIFRRYPNVFPEQITNTQYKAYFEKAYNFICSRAFGWSLPSISLIPMADSLNHNNDYVTHMLIDLKLEAKPHEMYSAKHKKYNLSILSQLSPDLPKVSPPPRKRHRKDKFVTKHKEILASETKKDKSAFILWQQYKAGFRNFRQLHYYDESCQEDNDTDEETIQDFEFRLQKFRFYEKYEAQGITEKNKTEELIKYWKLFLDPAFEEESSSEGSEKPKSTQVENKAMQEAAQKFESEGKQSQGSSLVSSSSSSDSDDQEFKWMAGNPESHTHSSTYFIMATRNAVKANQQLYNFYGRRSNRFLLVGYNFVLGDNKYDSFAFRVNIQNWKTCNKPFRARTPVPKIILRNGGKLTTYYSRQLRLKRQRVCMELMNHCRALLIGWSEELPQKRVTITIPFDAEFQKKVLALGIEFVKTFTKQFMTSIEEDEQLLEKAQKHETQTAIRLRIGYKKILNSQLELLELCLECLKIWNWKQKKLNVKDENQMREFGKIRQYLCSLERAKA